MRPWEPVLTDQPGNPGAVRGKQPGVRPSCLGRGTEDVPALPPAPSPARSSRGGVGGVSRGGLYCCSFERLEPQAAKTPRGRGTEPRGPREQARTDPGRALCPRLAWTDPGRALCPRLAGRPAAQPLLALLHAILFAVLPQPLASAPVLRGRREIGAQPLLLSQEAR